MFVKVSRKTALCNQVFDCAGRDFDLAMPDMARTERVDCDGLGQVCPGVSGAVHLIGLTGD